MGLIKMGAERIEKEFETAIVKGIFPGAVVLCGLGSRIIYYEAFGRADIFENRSMEKESIFDLASLTKPLATALAIAKLMELNKLSTDQTIGDILPEFRNTEKSSITVDMLLRHTSGLPAHRNYYLELVKNPENLGQCLKQLLISESLENLIGQNEVYSDLGFMILSWIIERLTNQRLDQFVSETLYDPIGIEDLFFMPIQPGNRMTVPDKTRFVSTQFCSWRKRILTGEVDDENAWALGGVSGHAGLFGNAMAVYRVCLEILNTLQCKPSTILKTGILHHLIKKNKRFQKVAGFDTPSKQGSSTGSFFSENAIGHLGFTGTSFWIDPAISLIVVLLTNRVHPHRSNEGIKEFRPKIHNLIRTELIENYIWK